MGYRSRGPLQELGQEWHWVGTLTRHTGSIVTAPEVGEVEREISSPSLQDDARVGEG